MINFGGSSSGLLGLALIVGALGYLAISINQVSKAASANRSGEIILRTIQAIFGPIILFSSGVIMLFQGWRLEPLLLFQNLLLVVLVGYLILIDARR